MKLFYTLLFIIALLISHSQSFAQANMQGEVRDFSNNEFLLNVNVRNIHTLKGMTIGNDGQFSIEIKKGDLVEFSKVGYQTLRIRIQNEKEPSFYKLVMNKAPIMLREVDIKGKPLDFVKDSIRYREVYDLVLRKDKKDDVDMRSMPLAMLSKKNRQEWAFQEMYDQWEREKYIDYVFNEKLVARITYLKEDELKKFMMRYRPSYEFLRTASDYEYLDYIKHTYYRYKNGNLR